MKCPSCGADIPDGSKFCTSCGEKIGAVAKPAPKSAPTTEKMETFTAPKPKPKPQPEPKPEATTSSSSYSSYSSSVPSYSYTPQKTSVFERVRNIKWKRIGMFLLCLTLGLLGAHRFAVHKMKTGALYCFTAGLFFIGWIVDLVQIARGKFTDAYGFTI